MPTIKTATGNQKWLSVSIAFHNGCFKETSCNQAESRGKRRRAGATSLL